MKIIAVIVEEIGFLCLVLAVGFNGFVIIIRLHILKVKDGWLAFLAVVDDIVLLKYGVHKVPTIC